MDWRSTGHPSMHQPGALEFLRSRRSLPSPTSVPKPPINPNSSLPFLVFSLLFVSLHFSRFFFFLTEPAQHPCETHEHLTAGFGALCPPENLAWSPAPGCQLPGRSVPSLAGGREFCCRGREHGSINTAHARFASVSAHWPSHGSPGTSQLGFAVSCR